MLVNISGYDRIWVWVCLIVGELGQTLFYLFIIVYYHFLQLLVSNIIALLAFGY